jgi:Putative silver efflux pump
LTSATLNVLDLGFTSSHLTPRELHDIVQWQIRPRLLGVPGVAQAALYGGGVRELQIDVDPRLLAAFHVGFAQVVRAVHAASAVRGGGFIDTPAQRIVINVHGQTRTPQQLADSVLQAGVHGSLLLGDVARIHWGDAPAVNGALINGRPGVLLVISGQYGSNTVRVTQVAGTAPEDPGAAAEEPRGAGPPASPATGRHRRGRDPRARRIAGHRRPSGRAAAAGFPRQSARRDGVLRRDTAVLLAAVLILQSLGHSLNTMTLGGLAVAIGVVVDDAVIDVENVLRRLRERPQALARQTVLEACWEVRPPVVLATVMLLLVLLPVLLLRGIEGAFFAPLALAFALATLASLGVALSVTPALALLLFRNHRPQTREPRFLRWLKQRQEQILQTLLDHPRSLLVATVLSSIAAVVLLAACGRSLLPAFKEREMVLTLTTAPGTSLTAMQSLGLTLSRRLLAIHGVADVEGRLGRAQNAKDAHPPSKAEFEVRLADGDAAEQARTRLAVRRVLGQFPGVAIGVTSFLGDRIGESLTSHRQPVVIQVFGNDLDRVDQVSAQLVAILRRQPDARDVRRLTPPRQPEMQVRLDRPALALYGLTARSVLDDLYDAWHGVIANRLFLADRSVPVRVWLQARDRRDPDRLGKLELRSADGALLQLSRIASIRQEPGRSEIDHDDGLRVETVGCNPSTADIVGFVRRAQAAVRHALRLPAGVSLRWTGAAEAAQAATLDLARNALLALVLIVLVLAATLRDARKVLLVLSTLPLAWIGGAITVWLGGGVLSLGSLVGLVTLFGIAARNAVLLLSHYAHLQRTEGARWNRETVLRGARERLTPVLLTTALTGAGLLPIALRSASPGHEIEGPMAQVILGGLLSSTVLTLLLLPGLSWHWLRPEPERRPPTHTRKRPRHENRHRIAARDSASAHAG